MSAVAFEKSPLLTMPSTSASLIDSSPRRKDNVVMAIFLFITACLTLLPLVSANAAARSSTASTPRALTTLRGKLHLPAGLTRMAGDVSKRARIMLDGGVYVGFAKENLEFIVSAVEPGSYLVEVDYPDLIFETVRVDITAKGKIRARRIDLQFLRPPDELKAPYPLKLTAVSRANYFTKREQWRVQDILMNPMLLMMLLPMGLMYLLPKMQENMDPETRTEMERMQLQPGQIPDVSEMMTNMLGSGTGGTTNRAGGKQGEGSRTGDSCSKSRKKR